MTLTLEYQFSLFYLPPAVLMLASLIDLAVGDPKWLPHPVRIMGYGIQWAEKFLRNGEPEDKRVDAVEKFKGALLVIIIVGMTFATTAFIVHILLSISSVSRFLLVISSLSLIYLVSTTIAARELISAARIVIREVRNRNIENARNNLSMIVGRDTQNLSEEDILKATIETLSENLSDGVVAPLFYLAIGGLPLAMAYKAINTLDSMIGYKNEKYKNFGWAAARLDDIANYIPARISGILIVIVSFFVSRSLFTVHCSLKTMFSDGRKHTSPNAGIPEAAMAGALGVRLGGPSTYGGIIVQKPYIGPGKAYDYLTASEKTINVVMFSSIVGIALSAIVLYLRGIYG